IGFSGVLGHADTHCLKGRDFEAFISSCLSLFFMMALFGIGMARFHAVGCADRRGGCIRSVA
ncbi:MAG: hypothetical protein EB107_03320, partial [Proteobacteria bacterium]|nr:hypothetical protein [Pseudomonadota bacterium]